MLDSLVVDEAMGRRKGSMGYADDAHRTDGARLPPDDAVAADEDGEDSDVEQARSGSPPHRSEGVTAVDADASTAEPHIEDDAARPTGLRKISSQTFPCKFCLC